MIRVVVSAGAKRLTEEKMREEDVDYRQVFEFCHSFICVVELSIK